MKNATCGSISENHRWGWCVQICDNCGVQDKITVNFCDSDENYVCYSCGRAK